MELLEDVPHGLRECHLRAVARITELEAENKKVFDYVRKLRMYCIYAEWGNPDTEDEFNEFDKEICKYLSEYLEVQE
jgi:hypothetical protein